MVGKVTNSPFGEGEIFATRANGQPIVAETQQVIKFALADRSIETHTLGGIHDLLVLGVDDLHRLLASRQVNCFGVASVGRL